MEDEGHQDLECSIRRALLGHVEDHIGQYTAFKEKNPSHVQMSKEKRKSKLSTQGPLLP